MNLPFISSDVEAFATLVFYNRILDRHKHSIENCTMMERVIDSTVTNTGLEIVVFHIPYTSS